MEAIEPEEVFFGTFVFFFDSMIVLRKGKRGTCVE